jgi:integrase
LSLSTIHRLHSVLHLALKHAVRAGEVARNVTDLFDAPTDAIRTRVVLDGAQIQTFLIAARDDPWEALWVPGVTTGMRAGEMLALTWHHVDLDAPAPILRVVASLARDADGHWVPVPPKTAAGRRTILLLPPVSAALRHHRTRQKVLPVAADG